MLIFISLTILLVVIRYLGYLLGFFLRSEDLAKVQCFHDLLILRYGTIPIFTSAKGLGGWGKKMAIFADVQYYLC